MCHFPLPFAFAIAIWPLPLAIAMSHLPLPLAIRCYCSPLRFFGFLLLSLPHQTQFISRPACYMLATSRQACPEVAASGSSTRRTTAGHHCRAWPCVSHWCLQRPAMNTHWTWGVLQGKHCCVITPKQVVPRSPRHVFLTGQVSRPHLGHMGSLSSCFRLLAVQFSYLSIASYLLYT